MSNAARKARLMLAADQAYRDDPFAKALEKLAEINRQLAEEAEAQIAASRQLRDDFAKIFGGDQWTK